MTREAPLYVYILSSETRQLVIGFTYHLSQRLAEHRTAAAASRRSQQPTRLVHVEGFLDPLQAIHRHAELNSWPRNRQQTLIQRANPTWRDLAPSL